VGPWTPRRHPNVDRQHEPASRRGRPGTEPATRRPSLRKVARIAHRHGARVAVDAAQLAPHRAIDIATTGIDYVAFSGHKLYAPFGAGVLAGRADWLDSASPYLRGGGASAKVTTSSTTWATGPARHEGGSPNVIRAVAVAAACAAITANRSAIESHEEALLARLRRPRGRCWRLPREGPNSRRTLISG